MDKREVVKVLEEFEKVLMNCYKADGCVTSAITEIYKNQTLTKLDALYKEKYLGMLPEEIEDYCQDESGNAYNNGFNSAIQERREKIG